MSETLLSTASESPLHFAGNVPVSERLAACKEFLKNQTAALRARHAAGASGLTIAHDRAARVLW